MSVTANDSDFSAQVYLSLMNLASQIYSNCEILKKRPKMAVIRYFEAWVVLTVLGFVDRYTSTRHVRNVKIMVNKARIANYASSCTVWIDCMIA